MFTGLVRTTGELVDVRDVEAGRVLVVASALDPADLGVGASVCVSGVCLTVIAHDGSRATFEVGFETLRRTTLGRWSKGHRCNLEPSLRLGDALGGHMVSGHVDAVARLRSSTPRGGALEMWFDVEPALHRFVAPKGSITLDGVSLTVNEVDERGFMVGIIPHTSQVTTLGQMQPGDEINLEVDMLARYVERLLRPLSEKTS